jgi:4-diphosphocytidyl-2-C-methyl-D-erythritol kinase
MADIVEMAPAKINLALRVLGRRPDGYHALESLLAFADAADRLTLDPSQPDGFSMAGPTAGAIGGPNLVARVLSLVRAAAPGLPIGHIHLDKHLPVAAGIGGGSADAAAALRLILRRHPGEPRLAALASEAVGLGADVPACLKSRALVMGGIGESVRPLRRLAPLHAVLVNPGPPLSTASVFQTLAAPPVPEGARPLDWPEAIETLGDLMTLIADRPNDLEAPARRLLPVIGTVLDRLAALPGCRLARMSGSGPTCFGLFDTPKAAATAAAALARAQPDWWVRAVLLG